MAPRLLARVVIDPDYPRPLTQRDLDWLADLLSTFASEMLKGEHRGTRTLFVHEPPRNYRKTLAEDGYVDQSV